MNNDPLAKALDIEPFEEADKSFTLPADLANVESLSVSLAANQDFETARGDIHAVIDTGKNAIERLAEIADQSQQPRAFEVLAKLIDTVVNANRELMDLHARIREIKHIDEPFNSAKTVTNNNLFLGSTAELSRLLTELKKGKELENIREEKIEE